MILHVASRRRVALTEFNSRHMYSDIIIEGIEEDEMCRLENLSLFLFVLVLCCMCVYYV